MNHEIIVGDCRDALDALPDQSVHCVVTSPPYWAQRDYGVQGQIGLEPTVREHIEVLVDVFRRVRRVLRDDGTVWLNYGDGYSTPVNGSTHLTHDGRVRSKRDNRTFTGKAFSTIAGSGLPSKNLLLLPARLAIALQDDGWFVRSEIIWHKTNPIPCSIKDRPGSSHEKVFLLSKSPRYYYDHESVRVPAVEVGKTRGLRDVWTISTKPFKGAHFATFPPALAEPCIKAGCPAGGVVLDPFGGTGTVSAVAESLGRNSIIIELNDASAGLAEARIHEEFPLLKPRITRHGEKNTAATAV